MKRKLLFALAALLIMPHLSFGAGYFSDVPTDDPNYKAIQYLKENGVIQGYADGTFKPNNQSNRAEALKMLLVGSKIETPPVNGELIFPDIPSEAWYAQYVLEAKKRGIVKGNPDGLFYPGNSTNLSEFLKMLLETNQIELTEVKNNPYADVPADRWDAPYANTAKTLNLMNALGSDPIYPDHAITRGEMAQLIYRLITGYHEGVASYYGNGSQGANTSSGEALNNNDFVAAHKRLPFGSWVKVTNLNNGESVNVRIVDRGPYLDGRVLDLSQAAFEALTPLSSGVVRVSVLPIADPNEICQTSDSDFIPKNAFEFITLNQALGSTYVQGEEVILSGQISGDVSTVSGFLINSAGEEQVSRAKVTDGQFKIRVNLPQAGQFQLGLSTQGEKNTLYPLKVLPGYCLNHLSDSNLDAPGNFTLKYEEGNLSLNWEPGVYNFFHIVFSQNELKKDFFTSEPGFIPPYYAFKNFSAGEVEVTLQGTTLNAYESAAKKGSFNWSLPNTTHFQATTHQPYFINEQKLNPIQLSPTFSSATTVNLSADPLVDLQQEAWIGAENGFFQSLKLSSADAIAIKDENDLMVFPAASKQLKLSFIPVGNAAYQVEWKDKWGMTALRLPLYPELSFPLLPNPDDFPKKTMDLTGDSNTLQQQFLNLVNADRVSHGASPIVLDDSLKQLAQARAQDMANNDYFGPWNKEGKSANDLRQQFGVQQAVSENSTQKNTLILAEYDFFQSPSHRANLLNSQWTRAGFGISKNKDGSYTFVQIFSADPVDLNDLEGLRQKILVGINTKRSSPFSLNSNLNSQAQQWSERMVSEDFFALTKTSGDTLTQQLNDAGIQNALGSYIVGNTSFEGLLDQIGKNAEIHSSVWKELGVGLDQDEFGVLKMTLVYVE